jgi:hypothetical protein
MFFQTHGYKALLDVTEEFEEAVHTPAKDDPITGSKVLINTPSGKRQIATAAVLILPLFIVGLIFFFYTGDSFDRGISLVLLALGIFGAINIFNDYYSRTLISPIGITRETRWPFSSKSLRWQDIVSVVFAATRAGNRYLEFTDCDHRKINVNIYSEGLKDLIDFMQKYLSLETYVGVLWLVRSVERTYNPRSFEAAEAARTPAEIEKTKQAAKVHEKNNLKNLNRVIRWLLGISLPVNVLTLALMWWKNYSDLFVFSFLSTFGVALALIVSTQRPGTNRDKIIRWLLFAVVTAGLIAADIVALWFSF